MDVRGACRVDEFWIYVLEKRDAASLAAPLVEVSLFHLEEGDFGRAEEALMFLADALEAETEHRARQFAPEYLPLKHAGVLYEQIWEMAQFMAAAGYWSQLLAPGWYHEDE